LWFSFALPEYSRLDRGGQGGREVAEALGYSKDKIARALKEKGIEARSNIRRSSLRHYDLKKLEEGVNTKGLRGFARELRVDSSTLLHHILKFVRSGRGRIP